MEQITQATAADVPALVELLADLFALERDFKPDASRQERGLRLIMEHPEVGRIYCARQNGKAIGMVSLLFTISTVEGGLAAWVEDMVVHASQRGKGIGERLLRHAIGEARALGCARLSLLTDCTNSQAIRLYERVDFVRSHMVPFRLSLRGER